MVPEGAAAGFCAIVNPTVPLPAPVAPLVSISHVAFDVAVHVHVPADAVTLTEPDPPTSATSCVVCEIENVHGAGGGVAAACVTVNVFPAAAIVALRAVVAVIAATLNPTLPSPLPEFELRLIHEALVAAVHEQLFADALMAIVPGPPASAKFCDVGEIEKEHAGGGAAACEIVNVLPAAVMVAFRAAPVFAATR